MNRKKYNVKKMEFRDEDEFSTYGVVDIFRNLLLMLHDRGYPTKNEYDALQYPQAAKAFWDNLKELSELNRTYESTKNRRTLKTIWLPEIDNDKVKIEHITGQLKAFIPDRIQSDVIIISNKEIGSPAGNKLEVFENLRIEFFTYDRLRIEINKHILVDPIELLSKDEVNTILKNMQINASNLPFMLTSDMQARWYGLKAGDVVRVRSDRENLGKKIDYRIVVPLDTNLNPVSDNEIFN